MTKWHDAMTGNQQLMREIAGEPRLTACWAVLPSSTGEVPKERELVRELLESGARAARLCPKAHGLVMEPWLIGPLVEALAEKRVPLLLDFDTSHYSEPKPWRVIHWLGCT